ncbi:MAG: arylesterase [Pseudomonadota bacterium]
MWSARFSPAKRRALAATWLLLALGACGEAPQATLAHLPADGLVLAFGNSLTHGTGATPGQSYPAVLQELIGRRVIESGRPGELSGGGLARLAAVLDQVRPDLVILCHGGNDILRRRNLGKTAANLRAMIRLAQDKGAQVVLIGVPEPSLFGLEVADFYRQVADEFGVPYEGDALAEILGDDALKSDPIHPNAAGYEALAQAVADLLRQSGALTSPGAS